MRRFLIVPTGDLPAPVQIELPIEGVALGAYEGIIAVWEVVVLEEEELALKLAVQRGDLLRVSEHVVVAAQEHLSPRQRRDVFQILLTLCHVAAPAVIADEYKGVRVADMGAVLPEPLLMVFPYLLRQLPRRFQRGLVMQVQISDCV